MRRPQGAATIEVMLSPATNRRRPEHLALALAAFAVLELLAIPATLAADEPKPTSHRDEIEVARILIDARVVDAHGEAIPDLNVTNFRVRIGRKRAVVESAEWISGRVVTRRPATVAPNAQPTKPTRPAPGAITASSSPTAPNAGRLIIFFFQRDLHPTRMVGLMKMVQRADELLDTLEPNDRVAIFCYDSHLRLYSDFTKERETTRRILHESIITYSNAPPYLAKGFPSIASSFDAVAAKNAPNPERALWIVGQSLSELPGPKSMFFFGWGLGRMVAGSFAQLRAEYSTALRALSDSRVTVFSLDVTNADYHSLEGPLRTIAVDTGGFYVKTHIFSKIAIERVMKALDGHYLLTVRRPLTLGPGRHEISVTLHRASGTVYARRWIN